MEGIRGRLSYANVMATLAVFIALGGGAYALSRGEVKSRNIAADAVKAKHIAFGVRSTPMMATHAGLPTGIGNETKPVLGLDAAGGIPEMLVPERFVATGLRVRHGTPLTGGNRSWTLRTYDGTTERDTALTCTVEAGERSCASNARVVIPAGTEIWWRVNSQNATGANYALVSWRAVLP